MHNGQQNPQKFSIQYAESMYSNPYSTLVDLHIFVTCRNTIGGVPFIEYCSNTNSRNSNQRKWDLSATAGFLLWEYTFAFMHHCSVRMCQCIVYCAVGGAGSRVPLIDLHTAGMADYPPLPHTQLPLSFANAMTVPKAFPGATNPQTTFILQPVFQAASSKFLQGLPATLHHLRLDKTIDSVY